MGFGFVRCMVLVIGEKLGLFLEASSEGAVVSILVREEV